MQVNGLQKRTLSPQRLRSRRRKYGYTTRAERARFLRTIANEIDARGDAITEVGTQETGLPEARLQGERGRTIGQLRLFADHIEAGDYLDNRFDPALPDRPPPARRLEIRLVQRLISPVAVFGASNFPLPFSTAGGDTASALAAGCPQGPLRPARSSLKPLRRPIVKCGMHSGVVGFTGSLTGGRALFNLCAARPEPIPFFGELGSVNPMFILPAVLSSDAEALGKGWAGSLTMGAGQFCTNPGIAILPEGDAADRFVAATQEELADSAPQTMLTDGIAEAYRKGKAHFEERSTVQTLLATKQKGPTASSPNLYETNLAAFLADETLGEKVFGPLGLVVRVKDVDEMQQVARNIQSQLTITLHMTKDDTPLAKSLMPLIERKAGRLLVNGFPTGVEVVDSLHERFN